MLEPDAILARLDAAIRELLELRAAVVRSDNCPNVAGAEAADDFDNVKVIADDLAADNLLDTHAAQERFGYPRNTIAKWCRTESLGVMRGGRWLVSVPRLRRHLNGK